MCKPVVEYHCNKLPAPTLKIGESAYIFPAELMVREDDNVVQRKYGLTKTDEIVSIDPENGSFETNSVIYVLVSK